MRLATAIALLSLLSTTTSLSTGGQNPRHRRQERLGSSQLPQAAGTAEGSARRSSSTRGSTVDSDAFAQVVENENRKRKPKKKVAAARRPPLVDSALLRFLSKQKRLREQQNGSSSVSSDASKTSSKTKEENDRQGQILGSSSYSLIDAIEQGIPATATSQKEQQQQQQQQQQQEELRPRGSTQQPDGNGGIDINSRSGTSTVVVEQSESSEEEMPPKTDDSLDSWMGQFNRNRVAKVLMAAGEVDESLANQAGECVQSHVLARTARRRVREFLKERDSMWVGEGNETSVGANATEKRYTTKEMTQPEYGFVDVVDVMVENGLTAKDVATILTHTPSIAVMMPKRLEGSEGDNLGGETIEETLQRSLSDLLCTTLKLRRYDARKVLRNSPGLLTKRGSISAQQVVAAMSKLGVSTSSIARDKNGLPTLLSRPPAALFRLIAFLGSDAIRMPINKIGPLIRRVDCSNLLDAVAPVVRFQVDQQQQQQQKATTTTTTTTTTTDAPEEEKDGMETIPDVGILPAFVGRTIEQRKRLIDATYERMSTTAWTLRNEVGTSDLGKVIAAYPNVLLLDASKQVLPVAEYLMEELGIWEDDLARVLQLYPSLLGMPIEKMKAVVDFFVSMGVEEENLASIFRSFPALLTLDIHNDMVPVIQFLRYIGIKNVGRFISRLPPILGYSVKQELTPKWEFIRDIYTYPSFELSKFPAFFSYPMDRIRARFEYLRDEKRLPISLIAPDLVLRYGDRDFSMKVAGDDDEGEAYAAFLRERQEKQPGKKSREKQRRRNAPNKRQAAQ